MASHELRFRTLGSLLTILAIPLLCGAKGGCGGDVSIGDDATLCVDSACGGMPTIACADGSSPYTGRCIEGSDGKCGWESRGCPATGECEKSKCGPAIRSPSFTCSDGSIGGNTGKCLLHSDGTCGWELRECPTPGECAKEDCGPAPGTPSTKCDDGSLGGFTGRCLRNPVGSCSWEFRDCPPPKPGSCDVSTWGVEKACETEGDCTFSLHQLSCCGSMAAIGYNVKSGPTFATAESACRVTYPGCGCPASPTTTEDGLTAGSPGEIGVLCKVGKCTTYVRMTGTK